MSWERYSQWAPYVPVAKKQAQGTKSAAALAKKQGRPPQPIQIAGRKIATTFWGLEWCKNLEAYSDFANRLPRGATYVRNGSVVDLVIKPRLIEALVAGSETYTVKISIDSLPAAIWKKIKQDCSSSIDSLLDLLAGRFSDGVMQRLTQQKVGLFPSPKEIKMKCSCPDYSYCCKHLAAAMYGIGHRLDLQPELLFLLRDVDHQELVSEAVAEGNLDRELSSNRDKSLGDTDLGALFGIELDSGTPVRKATKTSRKATASALSPSKPPEPKPSKASKKVSPSAKIGTVKPPTAAQQKLAASKSGPSRPSSSAKSSGSAQPAATSRKSTAAKATPASRRSSKTPQQAASPSSTLTMAEATPRVTVQSTATRAKAKAVKTAKSTVPKRPK